MVALQGVNGELALRGPGTLVRKSAVLLLVSVQPLFFLNPALVLVNVGTAPLPSKQFAAFPKPTRSTTFAFGRQLERSMGVPGFVMATLPVRFSTNGEIGGGGSTMKSGVGNATP